MRLKNRSILLAICFISSALGGCAKQTAASAAATEPTTIAAAGKKHPRACDLVTVREMSAVLGASVTAKPGSNERPPSATECDYSSSSESNYAEIEVDWGGGELQSFRTAAKLAGGAGPPGSANPLKGLGEGAYQIAGSQVFISTGGNLMMIRFPPGSSDVNSKARRIYLAAKPRLS